MKNYKRKKESKNKFYFTLVLITITFFVSFYLVKNNTSSFLTYVSYPYIYLKRGFDILSNNKKLVQQIDNLERQLLEKSVIKNKNITLEEEINDLKKTLELTNIYTNYNIINATVISKNKEYFFNEFIIDKGSKDNIEISMAVVTYNGLIGKVDKVYEKTSSVKMLNNNQKISVKVKTDKNDVYGVITINKNNDLVVKEITNYENIKLKDEIVTTGLGIFPEGIFVGTVEKIEDDNNISKILYLKKEDLSNLKYVSVLGNKIND